MGVSDLAGLAALPLLAGATPAQMEAIADAMAPGRAAPGEVLGQEGEPGEVFWLLVEGQVRVTCGQPPLERHLADAGPGSILGELALLRDQPRTATVTATGECCFWSGGREALKRLLEVEPVRTRLRLLASRRLAQDLRPVATTLKDGTAVLVRPLLAADREALDRALKGLSRESMRHRFFTAGTPSPALIDYLVDIDYVDHFAWAVLDAATHDGMATGRYIRDPGGDSAEMAFTTVDRYQGRGLGTFLLGALGVAAVEAGIGSLFAYTMDDNRAMRAVFSKADARASYDEPGLVHVSVDPHRAAALLAPAVRLSLASAVHDIVTAASLALA
ncbi:MAG TPA: GNAT family N-acetyltransferase [Acidimicrobiales bacterium]|nr:GNAT family N-acetyltransferase [Acidimicrobiales bacterium]